MNNRYDTGIGITLIILFIGTFLCWILLFTNRDETSVEKSKYGLSTEHKYDGSYNVTSSTYHYEDVWLTCKGGVYKTRILVQDTSEEEYHYYQSIKQ